jgi:uncharacterized membrane protein
MVFFAPVDAGMRNPGSNRRTPVFGKRRVGNSVSVPVLILRCVYAMGMWKYILAAILLVIGVLEIVLALHGGLREALMQTSPLRLKQAESSAFLLAGISALVMGIGILVYGLFG